MMYSEFVMPARKAGGFLLMPLFKGPLRHHEGNRFVVKWSGRTLAADAWVLFETGRLGQVTGISMTKLDDGDYNFENLELIKVE